MQRFSKPKTTILAAVVIVTMAAVACICPLGLMANAQMTTMMDHDMGAQQMEGMCPIPCVVLPYAVGIESNGLVRNLPLVNPILTLAITIRPIFHPPTLA